jgi:zinc transport system permease protein
MFSSDLAAVTGIEVARTNLYFLLAFSLTILVGLRFMGALLSSTLIIVAAAVGRQLTDRMSHFLLLPSAASVASVLIGFPISKYIFKTSTAGQTIVIVSVLLFGLSLLFKRR